MPHSAAASDTPIMRQYQELKNSNPQAVLFFRLGDFYEMFGDDAKTAAPLLGLVLTSRQGVPMCGVPYHSCQQHIAKLLRAGHKVALAEQMEAPGPGKKLVRRQVVRLITPGTVIEDSLLDPKASNFLFAVEHDVVGWGAAVIDVSTGEFWATQALNDRESRRLFDLIARVRPSEILCSSRSASALRLRDALPPSACLTLYEETGTAAPPWTRSSVWINNRLACRAALKCRQYVAETQFHIEEILTPSYREAAGVLQLDETAIRTLELIESSSGIRRHSLWGLLDACRTPMGSRKLRQWILYPSTELPEIARRHNAVEDLFHKPEHRAALSEILREAADIPRVASRLTTRQAGPRDLAALRDSLSLLPRISDWFNVPLCPGLASLADLLHETSLSLANCSQSLARAVGDRPPARLSDGNFIKQGYRTELDELRRLKSDSRSFLERLEAEEREKTGIPSLKAGFNSVFGYYLEITKTHQAKAPARYVRKQTLAHAERYITPELKELENRILGAEEKILRLETRLFEELREQTLSYYDSLLNLSELLAELDVFNALAETAASHDYVKPVVDLSHELTIEDGRHPVLSALAAGSFVPNSLDLDADERQIVILTGPNMSGKSTYLRQNALIALMAQIGSFVPAQSAKIGLVDKILTRIGAQDALAAGASTFMVEMRETSHILKSATPRSLLILDEVGRGTSTFDGISIAWAVLEHLNSGYAQNGAAPRGPRVLFATHYFELTELAIKLKGVSNHNVEAKEWRAPDGKTEVVFLHKISPGPADRSYGIHVAALAGLPPEVLARAREILTTLETKTESERSEPELPLFKPAGESHAVVEAIRLLNPERMTPLEALSALSALKKKLN